MFFKIQTTRSFFQSFFFLAAISAPLGSLAQANDKSTSRSQDGRVRYLEHDRKQMIGVNSTVFQNFQSKVRAIAEHLTTLPDVRQPPQELCAVARPFIDSHSDQGIPKGSITLALPFYNNRTQQCPVSSEAGLSIAVNRIESLPISALMLNSLEKDHFYKLNPIVRQQGEATFFSDGHIVLSRNRKLPITPVNKEEFLKVIAQEWQQQVDEAVRRQSNTEDPYQRFLKEKPKMLAAQEQSLKDLRGQLSQAQLAEMKTNYAETMAATEASLKEVSATQAGVVEGLSKNIAMLKGKLERVRQDLARLSVSQKQLPACPVAAEIFENAGPDQCEYAQMIFRRNKSYFPEARTQGTVQLIVIQSVEPFGNLAGPDRTFVRQILKNLDPSGFERFLD